MDIAKVVFGIVGILISVGCLRQGGVGPHVHSIPTISPNAVYTYQLIDLNGLPTLLGESFTNEVKNGKWKWYDQHHRILRVESYLNDTLHGQARVYRHENPDSPMCIAGSYAHGLKVGDWVTWQGKGPIKDEGEGRWKQVGRSFYDSMGRNRIRYYLHPNERIAVELHMSVAGKDTHYRRYSPRGEFIDEGDTLPIIIR